VLDLKTICKFMGTILLGMAAFITITGPASVSSVGIEELPESMRNKR
jgi:hypothetical protein